MSQHVEIRVDPRRCVGSGTCVGIAPERFELEGGVAVPVQPVVVPDEDLEDAVVSCPVEAISVIAVEDDGAAG